MKTPINFLEYLEPDLGINILMWLYDPAELARASTTSRAWHYFVPFRNGERIGFSYLVSQKYCGDSAAIKVLRDSKIMNLNVKLGTPKKLVPAHNNGKHPSYYIIAGLVFLAVSVPYFHTEFGKEYKCEMPQSPNEEIVVISQVLMADITNGYEDIANTQVLAFNGQPVKNLKSLATMVESCNDEFS